MKLKITGALTILMAFVMCMSGVHAEDESENTVIALNNAGVKKMLSGNLKGAVKDFSAALTIQPDYEIGYRNRLIAYYKMKDYKSTINDFETLQKMRSFDQNSVYLSEIGDAYAHQGLTRQKAGDIAGALESFDNANYYSPGTSEYLHYRGVAKKAAGDTDGANEDFELEKQSVSVKSRVRR